MYIRSFEDIKEVADSRYSLTMLISKRAREIVDESETLTEYENENPVSIAYKEIMEGEIGFAKNRSTHLKTTEDNEELSANDETSSEIIEEEVEVETDIEDENEQPKE